MQGEKEIWKKEECIIKKRSMFVKDTRKLYREYH